MNALFETTNGFNFQIIDSLIESRGVRLTWFDYNTQFQLEHYRAPDLPKREREGQGRTQQRRLSSHKQKIAQRISGT